MYNIDGVRLLQTA